LFIIIIIIIIITTTTTTIIIVVVYFVINSVQKLLDTPLCVYMINLPTDACS
jgi:hypothetical protein